jgi:predicted transcriptional regulator of viral defense system
MATVKHPSLPRNAGLAGVVTTSDLLKLGLTPSAVRTLTGRGELLSLGHGAYATPQLVDWLAAVPVGDVLLRAACAVATSGDGSVVSHQTAAQIHGLDMYGKPPGRVQITRPPGLGSKSGKPGVQVHTARLPDRHVGVRLIVPVTSVSRTVIDMARASAFSKGVVVADSALRLKLASKKDLRAVVADCARWPGNQKAARVVEFADGAAESPLESLARVVFAEGGLPPPQLQVEITDDGFIGRVDFLWPEYRTIVEVDGLIKYKIDPARAREQLRRDSRLRRAGYEVEHFEWRDILEHPERVIAAIRAAFQRGLRPTGLRQPGR